MSREILNEISRSELLRLAEFCGINQAASPESYIDSIMTYAERHDKSVSELLSLAEKSNIGTDLINTPKSSTAGGSMPTLTPQASTILNA